MADLTLRPDELAAEMQGEIRVSVTTDGGRRLIHPSGMESIQTPQHLATAEAAAQANVAEAQEELAEIQEIRATITALVEAAG